MLDLERRQDLPRWDRRQRDLANHHVRPPYRGHDGFAVGARRREGRVDGLGHLPGIRGRLDRPHGAPGDGHLPPATLETERLDGPTADVQTDRPRPSQESEVHSLPAPGRRARGRETRGEEADPAVEVSAMTADFAKK